MRFILLTSILSICQCIDLQLHSDSSGHVCFRDTCKTFDYDSLEDLNRLLQHGGGIREFIKEQLYSEYIVHAGIAGCSVIPGDEESEAAPTEATATALPANDDAAVTSTVSGTTTGPADASTSTGIIQSTTVDMHVTSKDIEPSTTTPATTTQQPTAALLTYPIAGSPEYDCEKECSERMKFPGGSRCSLDTQVFGFNHTHRDGVFHCYVARQSAKKLNYYDATSCCNDTGGQMIAYGLRNKWILSRIGSQSPELMWAGLDKIHGTWMWSDGVKFVAENPTAKWDKDQPDNPNEKCAVYGNHRKTTGKSLHDYPCDHTFPFICEYGCQSRPDWHIDDKP